METEISITEAQEQYDPLYSLEKLIEWKPFLLPPYSHGSAISLYSLEKLIEWKLLAGSLILIFSALSTR